MAGLTEGTRSGVQCSLIPRTLCIVPSSGGVYNQRCVDSSELCGSYEEQKKVDDWDGCTIL